MCPFHKQNPNVAGNPPPQGPSGMLDALLDTIVDSIIVIDKKGIIRSANKAAENIFGYTGSEMVGKNVSMLMPEPHHSQHDSYLDAYHKTGEAKIIGVPGRELSAKRRDGSLFPIELGVSAMQIDGESLYVGIIRDITEQKRAENLKTELQAITDSVIDGLITIDVRGTIQMFNPASERIFGYSPEEVIGKNVKMLMPEPYHSEHDGYLEAYQKTNHAKIIGTGREVRAKRKDGSTFPMDLAVSKMDVDGRRMYVGIVRDITDRKEAEAEREKLIDALRVSNQELDDFAYIASHDLKEPLRGLHNNAMFLDEDYRAQLDAGGIRRLDRMRYLCQRMEALINDLLYFSRIGRVDLSIQETDLNELIHEVCSMIETTLEEKNVKVSIPSPLPRYTCDSVRVKEVFRNLVTNAIKYNDAEEKRIEIGYHETFDGHEDVFYVKDNGYGIDPKFHDEIFRIFKRLNSENEDTKGTGAGLTFVKKIVERHDGTIWLDSALGRGTTFYFTLQPTSSLKENKHVT